MKWLGGKVTQKRNFLPKMKIKISCKYSFSVVIGLVILKIGAKHLKNMAT